MGHVDAAGLTAALARCPPFDALGGDELEALAGRARLAHHRHGDVVLDAFTRPADDVLVVLDGQVELWNAADRIGDQPDETLGPPGVFGFSAVLTGRSIGPRAVAVGDVVVARIPAAAVAPVFGTPEGVRFLAEHVSAASRRDVATPTYTVVDELLTRPPVIVAPGTSLADTAALMTEAGAGCAVVRRPDAAPELVTDAALREAVLVRGVPAQAPAGDVAVPAVAVELGDSAAEALILLLERGAEYVLVTDRSGEVRGVVDARDFVVSSATAGAALLEQLGRSGSTEELEHRAARVPETLAELLTRGMAAGRVITVHSAIVDTVVRRAIQLVFAEHPELSVDAFTWLSLGSNGRREALLGSDVDAAAAFDDALGPEEIARYRPAFAEVEAVLTAAGLTGDDHGATPSRPLFARTNAGWLAAALDWLAHPERDNGAMMTSLLVDGRPIHGDPGLPAVTQAFAELRRHPGTMRLLLRESLAVRARPRTVRDLLGRRDRFDLKEHALLPIVNLARWAALAAGSPALPTIERLRAAAGSPVLPREQANTLVEVFEVLQQLRLRHQLRQLEAGERPGDVVELDRLSPIDRSIITRAVREIAAVQRRVDNVSHYVEPGEWLERAPGPA